MFRKSLCFCFVVMALRALGQDTDVPDTLKMVTVRAYEYNRDVIDVPAAVDLVNSSVMNRFSNSSLVSALNTVPGVRMEERSPGSYRISMRGSLLRSPFGVRNVKVYWNDLPMTDATGNTYLNLLEPDLIGSVEVIKGPGSSIYGAGTGGVILLNGVRASEEGNEMDASSEFGSYGLRRISGIFKTQHKGGNQVLNLSRQDYDGYRDNTALRRTVGAWNGTFNINSSERIAATMFYSDLYYQIPGGLTQQQMDDNPRQARANAAQNGVSSHLRSFYSGVSHRWVISPSFENTTGVFANSVRYENPFFTDYEHRSEMHTGGRTDTRYHFGKSTINAGAELEYSYIPSRTYATNSGVPGVLQQDDELSAAFSTLFAQWEIQVFPSTQITLGASYNRLRYSFLRLLDSIPSRQSRTYKPVMAPRLAVLQKLNEELSVYGSISKGFSTPSYAEVYPAGGIFNNVVNPEEGVNFELGGKASIIDDHLMLDAALYQFRLNQAIVDRKDSLSDHYFNAGKTNQKGIELSANYRSGTDGELGYQFGTSYTFNDYHYLDYVNSNGDYSGNRIPGIPANTIVLRADLNFESLVYFNATFQHTDAIVLNDANDVHAKPYNLIGFKTGCHLLKNRNLEIYLGIDNLLNEVYSLGNDLNAFGNRYFNPAPGRNYYGGVKFDFGNSPKDP